MTDGNLDCKSLEERDREREREREKEREREREKERQTDRDTSLFEKLRYVISSLIITKADKVNSTTILNI